MQMFQALLSFPEHHIVLAWWLALAIPLCGPPLWSLLKKVPIWGLNARMSYLENNITVLENLHNNPYGLVVFLAHKATSMALEVVYACVIVTLMEGRSHPIPTPRILYAASITLAGGLAGIALRVRTVLNGLTSFSTNLPAQRQELTRLRALNAKPKILPELP